MKNELNNLGLVWYKKEEYSSWCKFKDWFEDRLDKGRLRYKQVYGQLNFFFRIIGWEFDKLLNKVAMAAITSQKTDHSDLRRSSFVTCGSDKQSSINYEISCIPAYIIDSTNIVTCATTFIGKEEFPIATTSNLGVDYIDDKYHAFNKANIAKLYLIDMQPERKHVSSSLEESKVVEPDN